MADWTYVASGTLGSALDLGSIADAMNTKASLQVDALDLEMYAPGGWPWGTVGLMLGATSSGNTVSKVWQFPWLGTLESSQDILSPAWAGPVQAAITLGGPIDWTLYQQAATTLSFVPNTATRGLMGAAGNAVGAAINAVTPTAGSIPWLPIALGAGALILIWKEL